MCQFMQVPSHETIDLFCGADGLGVGGVALGGAIVAGWDGSIGCGSDE